MFPKPLTTTFSNVFKFSWLIIFITVVVAIASFSLIGVSTYKATITLGLSFNHPTFLEAKQDSIFVEKPNFLDTQGKLSRFLENRLASVESQEIVAKELGLENLNFNADKPFYKLTDQELGFITVSYSTKNKNQAEKFNQVIYKQVYPKIIDQWNDSRITNFQISAIQKPVESVQTITTSLQEKLIAPIAVLIISSLVIALWPFKNKDNLNIAEFTSQSENSKQQNIL